MYWIYNQYKRCLYSAYLSRRRVQCHLTSSFVYVGHKTLEFSFEHEGGWLSKIMGVYKYIYIYIYLIFIGGLIRLKITCVQKDSQQNKERKKEKIFFT